MVEMLCTHRFIGNNVNSPLLLIHDITKRPEAFASPKQAMKPILRPRFGIDPDPDHTLFADALFIRRSKTDGLLKRKII
jgi:hypothetical protein